MSARSLVLIAILLLGLGGGYLAYRALMKPPAKVPVPSAAPATGSAERPAPGSAAGTAAEVAPIDGGASVTSDVARSAPARGDDRRCVDMPGEAIVDGCPRATCGDNAPFLSGFGLGSLHPDGCSNGQGVHLLPTSVEVAADSPCGAHPGGTLRLDVDGGDLIARDASGAVACKGPQLAGVSFAVAGPAAVMTPGAADSPDEVTRRVHIAAIDAQAGWQDPAAKAQTYTLVDDAGKGLCRGAADWRVDWANADGARPAHVAAPAAVLVTGELYVGASATVYTGTVPDVARWFTIGCAGGALSKMRLLGMDPRAQPAEVDRRQATLKMITAHYCPDQDFAFTAPGTPLVWSTDGNVPEMDAATRRLVGPIEARWTKQGAACVSHGRVWQQKAKPLTVAQGDVVASEADLMARIGACGVPTCDQPTAGPDTVYWTTYTVSHQKH